MNIETSPRTLAAIAREIRRTWPKPYFGAVPYIDALLTLEGLNDSYGYDDARSIARYFLANAGTWRGEDARRIKAELKIMLGDK
jgi:hypothetical protein